ncbi:MAG: hypothetical protein K6U12_00685, partial [Armatimonadetes bacterium]|nr:hypothetical protein [Armatimonadota bacterium]
MTRRHPRKLDFETIIRIPELGVEHVSERNGERHAMGHCPCHDDKKRSLSLTEKPDGTVLAHCFAGCKQETVWRELYRLAGVQSARANLILPRQRQQARNADAPAHLTLEQYARAKGLDANLLREWGLTDTERGIAIPYLDTDGNQVATRYRLALDGENRFRWARGDTPTLYGLGRLPEWGDSDTVYLVEGETDTLTLWSAGLPALGVPGASVWRAEWWLHLTRFQRI